MLTPKDLASNKISSGFKNVSYVKNKPGTNRGGKPWHARKRLKSGYGTGTWWSGPRRNTALEAAQDYCDWANGRNITSAPELCIPNHPKRQNGRMSEREKSLARDLNKARQERLAKETKRAEYVYLIGMREDPRAAKIGFSDNPEARAGEMQPNNPWELYVIGKKPGGQEEERRLHSKYIALNTNHEWFRLTSEILAEFDFNEGSPLD